MIQDTRSLPRLWKMKKTCGPKQIQRCCGNSTITSGRTKGSLPVCAKKSGMSENVSAQVCFCKSEFTGVTATRMTRGDELPRHMIPDSEWPRFLQATVAEWAAILDTSAVTIISPTAARDIRKPTESFLRDMFIVRSLEKVSEQCQNPSVGGVFLVIVIQTYDSLNDLLQHHKRPQFTHSRLLQQSSNVK